jgi:hypothetical protein
MSLSYPPAISMSLAALMATLPQAAGIRAMTTEGQSFQSKLNPYDGTTFYWAPVGYQRVMTDTAVVTGAKQTAEQAIKTLSVLPGLFYSQRVLFEWEIGKTGTTDIGNQCNLHLGAGAGSLADPFLVQTGFNILAAGKRSAGYSNVIEFGKVNTFAKRGSGGGVDNGSFSNAASGTALGTTGTLTGVDLTATCALILAMTMTAATTDSPQIGAFYATLIP